MVTSRSVAPSLTASAALSGVRLSTVTSAPRAAANFTPRCPRPPRPATTTRGWAVGIYDENLRHPDLVRLIAWLRLERRPADRLTDSADDKPKLEAIARAQAVGRVRPGDPFDLFALVLAMACTWSPASGFYTATAGEPAAEHDRRRALLRDCVQRAVAP